MINDIPLIVGIALGTTVAIGYVLVLIGMRQEDRHMRLADVPPTRAAGLARRVTGCHVRSGTATAPHAPGRA